MKNLWQSFNISISMYSRLPCFTCKWTEAGSAYVMCFFPWIGIVIGALCVGWDALASWLCAPDPLRSAVMISIPLAVSGGIHIDGLLDTADALSSHRGREDMLRILKDPHAGAFASIACCAYFILLYAIIDAIRWPVILPFSLTYFISRTLSGLSVVSFPKASPGGTVSDFAKAAVSAKVRICLIAYLLISILALLRMDPPSAIAVVLSSGLTFAWYHRVAMKYFGGINGDLAGFFLSVCEMTVPASLVLLKLLEAKLM